MSDQVMIPFPRELYADLVRFSDGQIDPATLAVSRVENWIDNNFACGEHGAWSDDYFLEAFEARLDEFAEKYAPYVLRTWKKNEEAQISKVVAERQPLVWKEISIPAGSEVRMSYGGKAHYARVQNGKIVDEDGAFSPSEWAFKVANNTSRNAWRDLAFKMAGNPAWIPAQVLREITRRRLHKAARDRALDAASNGAD